jgi:hypothetical protein
MDSHRLWTLGASRHPPFEHELINAWDWPASTSSTISHVMELEYTPILFEFRRCDAAYSYRPSRIPDDPCRSTGTRALTLVRATKSGGRGGR